MLYLETIYVAGFSVYVFKPDLFLYGIGEYGSSSEGVWVYWMSYLYCSRFVALAALV